MEVAQKAENIHSWMSKVDQSMTTISGFLARMEPFIPTTTVPPMQTFYNATFICEVSSGQRFTIVKGVVKERSAIEGV